MANRFFFSLDEDDVAAASFLFDRRTLLDCFFSASAEEDIAFVEEVHRAETEIVNVRWSGVARNVVPCGLVERCEQRSASGVGGGVHGGRIEKERGEFTFGATAP